ncbi:DUF2497 domain-containing protein [Erythrobacter sp. YT30]|uniref:DUF2497 domain-containing protein n=1 Tax=Erythrobacter sp. YT30 TaxID=1735012 RepID=UPI00076D402A|nr:DUF2497 domain-containing protein [Erythrobacter sp. YT30]KWV91427.1 hypothetical protein AUC45_09190 [Erythrobacter sp. YT30]
MAQQHESSVEDILDSIKKVIARDNRDIALKARQRREVSEEGDMDKRDDSELEALDLTEQAEAVEETGAIDESSDEVLDLGAMDCVVDDEAGDDFASEPETEETVATENHEAPLINDQVRGAMQENLAALAMLAEPGAKPQIVRTGETSLEGMTRELLRPMLAEWLDKNLPGMVEKMVQAEIQRIAGKRR